MSEETKDMPKVSSDTEAPKALNYIEKLVAELCPEGVEYKALGDFSLLIRGQGMPKSDFSDTGIGAIHYGQVYTRYGVWTKDVISYVSSEKARNLVHVNQGDLIITNTSENLEDVCKSVAYLGEDYIVTGGHATVISQHGQNAKYLSYYFASLEFQKNKRKYAFGTKVIEVSSKNLAKILIPVPPLEVQNAIVEILDKFTKLEAELEAELAARRAQYEYYRNSLFENLSGGGAEILGNLVQYVRDKTKSLMKPLEYVGVENLNVDFQGCTPSLSTISGTQYIPSDILLGNIRPYLKKMWISNNEGIAGSDVLVIRVKDEYRNDIIPKFLYHQLTTSRFLDYNVRNSRGGKMPRGNKKKILEFPIFLPPLAEQERIVKILDKFDVLVNDISSGLPAEIEARRKQYEYYRDRLLTFPRASDFTEHKH